MKVVGARGPSQRQWGDDELTRFFDGMRQNQRATFDHKADEFTRLVDIDDCFERFVQNGLANPKKAILEGLLIVRSHSAFRAAASLVTSGQVSEAYPVMRACIEYAGFALHLNVNNLAETWLRRHDDEKSLKKVRREFAHGAVLASITAKDKKLGSIYERLYDRFIDYGGHPNERGLTSSMTIKTEPGKTQYMPTYRHGNDKALNLGLKNTAHAGLCALHIFQFVFPERFQILDLTARLREIRKGL